MERSEYKHRPERIQQLVSEPVQVPPCHAAQNTAEQTGMAARLNAE